MAATATVDDTGQDLYTQPTPLAEIFGQLELDISPDIGWEEWDRLGHNLLHITGSHQWWSGDWYLRGEENFGDQVYNVIDIDNPMVELATLKVHRMVAERIPPKDRRPELCWSAHRSIAKLPTLKERRRMLGKCAADPSLTTRMIDAMVKARLAELKPELDLPDTDNGEAKAAKTHRTYTLSFTIHAEDEESGDHIAEKLAAELQELLSTYGVEPTKVTPSKS